MAAALLISTNSVMADDYDTQIQQLVVSGTVEKWIGGSFISNIDNNADEEDEGNFQPNHDNYFASGQSGRLSLPLGDMLSLQMDAQNEITSNAFTSPEEDDEFSDDFSHAIEFGLHVSARDPSRGLVGAFAAFGQGKGDSVNGRQNFWAVGGEAQYYADDTTFYLQAGYLDSNPQPSETDNGQLDGLHSAFFVRGVARWFMTPDSRLQGEVAYAHGKQDNDGPDPNVDPNPNRPFDMDVIQWGARYDTVLSGLPLIDEGTVFIGYRGIHFDNLCCDDEDTARFTEHTVMAGFAYRFGGSTLKEFDRVGATLDLPNFGRWVAGGEQID